MRRSTVAWVAVVVALGCSSTGGDDGGSAGGSGGASAKGGQGGANGGSAGTAGANAGSGGKSTTGGSAGATDENAGAPGDDECTPPLSELAHYCKPTFDGSADDAAKAGCTYYSTSACDGLLWIDTGHLGGTYCSYDAITHELVGAIVYNDTPSPCSDPEYDAIAGRTPSNACLLQQTDCSDLSVAGAPQ